MSRGGSEGSNPRSSEQYIMEQLRLLKQTIRTNGEVIKILNGGTLLLWALSEDGRQQSSRKRHSGDKESFESY